MADDQNTPINFLANVRGNSWFHRLDPRTKVTFLAVVVLVDLLFLNPLFLLAVFIFTLPVWFSSRVNLKPLLPQLIGVGMTLLALMLFIFSFSGSIGTSGYVKPGQAGISLGFLVFYPESFSIGAVQLLRMGIPMVTSLLVFATTDPTAFARALDKLKVPKEITFMIVTALRFFPLVIEEYTNVTQAQKVRGVSTKGALSWLTSVFRTSLPLLIIMLRKSREMGIAVEGRGFGAKKWFGSLRILKFERNDFILFGCLAVFICIALFVRFGLGLGWANII
jgi:energy-coupling factor transport system permease protein